MFKSSLTSIPKTETETPKDAAENQGGGLTDQETGGLQSVWSEDSGWDKTLVELANEFAVKAIKREMYEWLCCDLEAQMRKLFPKTPKKGEKTWGACCEELLKRDQNTVAADIRAVAYCDVHEPDWRSRLESAEFLPPPYLVARLDSVKQTEKRKKLHSLLFSNQFGTPAQFEAKIPKTGNGRSPKFTMGEKLDGKLGVMTRAILSTHAKLKDVEQSFVIQQSTQDEALNEFEEALKALSMEGKETKVSFVVFTKK